MDKRYNEVGKVIADVAGYAHAAANQTRTLAETLGYEVNTVHGPQTICLKKKKKS
jgi:hypothetical protein